MNKKQLTYQLNNQKGITGADIMIAMLIILTTVGVIAMIYVNLNISSKEIDRKTAATRIATNVLENLSLVYYDEMETNLKTLTDTAIATKVDNTYTIVGGKDVKVFETKVPAGYKLILEFEQKDMDYDLLKKVNVKVEYTVDQQVKSVLLSKVIEREVVRECNSPNFTEEYIKQMVPDGMDYEMFSETSTAVQTGVKIICPIQYDKTSKQYKLADVQNNQIWYSYSNKEWARVLVLESDEYNSGIDLMTKAVTNLDLLKDPDKSYVWVPRFGVKNGGDLFGDTLFQYKNSKVAILNSYAEDSEFVHYYLDTNYSVQWSNRGISFENDENLGKWSSYSDLSTVSTDAYILNQSQYGPMIEH